MYKFEFLYAFWLCMPFCLSQVFLCSECTDKCGCNPGYSIAHSKMDTVIVKAISYFQLHPFPLPSKKLLRPIFCKCGFSCISACITSMLKSYSNDSIRNDDNDVSDTDQRGKKRIHCELSDSERYQYIQKFMTGPERCQKKFCEENGLSFVLVIFVSVII